jgi:Flp pilus assembly pilin Flp
MSRSGGRDGGAIATEYAILASLIAAVIVVAVAVVGSATAGNLESALRIFGR